MRDIQMGVELLTRLRGPVLKVGEATGQEPD
jgi:hypothetical protein